MRKSVTSAWLQFVFSTADMASYVMRVSCRVCQQPPFFLDCLEHLGCKLYCIESPVRMNSASCRHSTNSQQNRSQLFLELYCDFLTGCRFWRLQTFAWNFVEFGIRPFWTASFPTLHHKSRERESGGATSAFHFFCLLYLFTDSLLS